MSLIKTNYSNLDSKRNDNFGVLPTGYYECIIKDARLAATRAGREYVNIQLTVRNDLDSVPNLAETNGKYHNRVVFMGIYSSRDTGKYNPDDLSFAAMASGIPEGVEIDTIQDFCDAIVGKPVKAYIRKTESEYQGQKREQNSVFANNLYSTDFPQVNHTWADKNDKPAQDPNDQPAKINEEELPF